MNTKKQHFQFEDFYFLGKEFGNYFKFHNLDEDIVQLDFVLTKNKLSEEINIIDEKQLKNKFKDVEDSQYFYERLYIHYQSKANELKKLITEINK